MSSRPSGRRRREISGSLARVYRDVNSTRPREYWDYEALSVEWGYVAFAPCAARAALADRGTGRCRRPAIARPPFPAPGTARAGAVAREL